MNHKALSRVSIAIALILITLIPLKAEDICHKAICTGGSAETYSGVYKGYVDTFGVCDYDSTKATVYMNFGTSPMTIIYDGCVLEDYSYAGEVVYYTGNNKQVELGRFDEAKNKDNFIYKRILNHFYAGEPKDYVPFVWTKSADLDVNNASYKEYLADYKKFKDFWAEFEPAFFKKDYDKLSDMTSFPLMDKSVDPAVKIEKKDFKKFMDNVFALIDQIRKDELKKYNSHDWFPMRFGDNDPCFARTYTWSFPSPRFNFTKVGSEYKLTNLYEYE